jgi:cytochrome P450
MIDATDEEREEDGKDKDMNVQARNEGKFTDKEVVGQAVGMLLAGYETTANALAYTSYLLALNPDIQEKLQSEIDTYFEEKPVSSHWVCTDITVN